jgi:hypothetical protein
MVVALPATDNPLDSRGPPGQIGIEEEHAMTISPHTPFKLSDIPVDHSRLNGRYFGHDENGVDVTLTVTQGQRPARGNELVNAHVQAMRRGRMPSANPMVDHLVISLNVGQGFRKDLTVNPNGTYSFGHLHGRTLKDIVEKVVKSEAPRPIVAKTEDAGPKPPGL